MGNSSLYNTLIAPSILRSEVVVEECSESPTKGSISDRANEMGSGTHLDSRSMLCYLNQTYIYIDLIKDMLVKY